MLESIRIGAILLRPFLPDTSEEIFRQLNTQKTSLESVKEFGGLSLGTVLNDPEPIFKRIENKEE